MATILLLAAGGAIGSSIGGGMLGLGSAVIGRAVGASVGQMVDRRIGAIGQNVLGSGSGAVEQGRLERLRLTSTGEGTVIPRVFGRTRIAGHVIWSTDFVETVVDRGESTGGGKGSPAVGKTIYSYTISLAFGLCEGEIASVSRIWADGQEVPREALNLRVYKGSEEQLPDPLIEAKEGFGNAPAYRGVAYLVIEDLNLSAFGNRVPQFSFEVIRNESGKAFGDMAEHVRAVSIIPGTGEYSLATTPVRYEDQPGASKFTNAHSYVGQTDFLASLSALNDELPNCRAASLVVSWFGNDLRCGSCKIRPMVERVGRDGVEIPWRAGGLNANAVAAIPESEGRPVYGGTPADDAVIEGIRALRDAGKDVMFYPFILMNQLAGNGLPDPYGSAEQAALPWRGRITGSIAPGRTGTVDRTGQADAEISMFFGAAQAGDFEVSKDGDRTLIKYSGPDEWSLRRFVLHYAHLCVAAGGVDSFCIASELRGLTQLRGQNGFPGVVALRKLAADVRKILGPETAISYAADWSEYFGYAPQDGSGDIYFHLDQLWADDNIDFVGIDNYMPLSDWRDRPAEADSSYAGPHDLGYLKANICGGEGYDWFYASAADRDAQIRTTITDGVHSEPWVWRYKDIRNWWGNVHHDRVGGVRLNNPTNWVPQSKPVRFTEIGCPAIDKGTNQPNKFVDPKSSESSLPFFSNGGRDDFLQVQYIRAMDEYWNDAVNNPSSDKYDGRMVASEHSYVWTWDARPYPQFPALADTWADGENYYRGHWITGRASYRTLQSVVSEICDRAGIADFDVSDLTGVVRGYTISDIATGRSAIQPLMLTHGFDAIEREGKLVFRMRSGTPCAIIDENRVVQLGQDNGDITSIRNPNAEQVARFSIGYIAEDGAFSARSADVARSERDDGTVARAEIPLVLTTEEGRSIAARWFAETEVGRDRIRFGLPRSAGHLGAGDVIEIRGGSYRIDRVELAEFQLVEASRVGRHQYDAPLLKDGITDVEVRIIPAPVLPVILDLPAFGREGDVDGPVIATASVPWSGEVSVHASLENSSYALKTVCRSRATIGETSSELVRGPVGRFDRANVLRVKLLAGDLRSRTEIEFLAGANSIAVGKEEEDRWEILQFKDAILVEPGTYELTGLLRGQFGTDASMPEAWPVGTRVVLLDNALESLGGAAYFRGSVRHFRIGPAAQSIEGPSYVHKEHEFSANWQCPLSPVHLKSRRISSGTEFTWVRRTRKGGDDWEAFEIPLGEEREQYLVQVMRSGVVVRETICESPRWVYPEADRLLDGPNCSIAVSQVSYSYGPGASAAILVPDLQD